MLVADNPNDFDPSFISQSLQTAHTISDSKIRNKKLEIENELLDLTNHLYSEDKFGAKQLRNISEEINKMRLNVDMFERCLNQIHDRKRNLLLVTKIETSQKIYKLNDEFKVNSKKLIELNQKILHQREEFSQKIKNAKNDVTFYLSDLDQIISDLKQEIHQTEIELFSFSNKNKQIEQFQTDKFEIELEIEESNYEISKCLENLAIEEEKLSQLMNQLEKEEELVQNYSEEIQKLKKERDFSYSELSNFNSRKFD
ncbi:hypothetical protein TRFO_39080 [Tritrichomonas foetus]|uniref:Uncharacterized protein n=1 Tax=Tritrichomonas foetus TaxID=1144522 RepID=A0A1J4J678_9EUKA|nr:hypothetical protein TRFO_39080 [Tritrichomonas foetus]|eukprot:OHS94730.1 hypothetical protein TRFO_39080 [Tritrichomonas foetus]